MMGQMGEGMGGAGCARPGMASNSMNQAPGLKLNLQGLNSATNNLDISQTKNPMSTSSLNSNENAEDHPQSRFSLGEEDK